MQLLGNISNEKGMEGVISPNTKVPLSTEKKGVTFNPFPNYKL